MVGPQVRELEGLYTHCRGLFFLPTASPGRLLGSQADLCKEAAWRKQHCVTVSHAADWPKCQSLIPPTVLVLELGELSVTVGGNRAGTNAF